MKDLKILPILLYCLCFGMLGCGQESRYVTSFKGTEAYSLAKAVEKEELEKIENLVKKNPKLLNVPSKSGSDVLSLSISIEKFQAFKHLLELGADPNFINPYTKYSTLINACRPFGSALEWRQDNGYAEMLLKNGADPNYAVEEGFLKKNNTSVMATSPLIKASSLDLDLVKLLIKYGADPNKNLKERKITPFSRAISSNNFDIIYYYIDTLKIDVHQPMVTRRSDELYIQDYIDKYMNYIEDSEGNQKKQKLIKYLEAKGVDFENHDYKMR